MSGLSSQGGRVVNKTAIEWCDRTLNPVFGCSHNCPYCYARERVAPRKASVCRACGDFRPHWHLERLADREFRSKTPLRVMVPSCGELFDPVLYKWRGPGAFGEEGFSGLVDVAGAMRDAPQHTFIIPTKRPDIMADLWPRALLRINKSSPLPNVHLGVSVTNQADADGRILGLMQTRPAVRWVSYEPAHGRIRWETWLKRLPTTLRPTFDWLVIGAETGNRKGKIVPEREWIQSAVDECREAGVPVFVKDNVVALYPEFAGIRELPK